MHLIREIHYQKKFLPSTPYSNLEGKAEIIIDCESD